MIEH